jgi:probable HAF family extracellular repeat protein
VEFLEGRCVPSTVTNLSDHDPGSLRDAIATTPPGGTVDFQPGLSGTITLTTGELAIDKDLTITGPGRDVITVSGNHASRVLDIVTTSIVAISRLTIADGGVTDTNGGGISNGGVLSLSDCLVSANSVSGTSSYGAGIYNAGTLTVSNSTLNDNSATYGGGGIYNAGTVTVSNSTLSGNASNLGGGIFNVEYDLSTVLIRNTIVASNGAPSSSSDVNGRLISVGHNLIGDGAGGNGYDPTDLVGTARYPIDPLLGPLQDNGGPTFTMALLPGSPAIDAGDNTSAPQWDQRGPGYLRVVNGTIDIGAFEVQDVMTFVVTNTNDSGPGSLRQAILDTNANPGPDTITFDISGAGVHTIRPTSPLPVLTDPVLINGASQPGYAGAPLIELSASPGGTGGDGLVLAAGRSTVRGLVINGFSGAAIHLEGAGGDVVTGNYLGTDATGTEGVGNAVGVFIDGTSGNTVGRASDGAGNLISGNRGDGVSISGSDNVVEGNRIGTDVAGAAPLPNRSGVVVTYIGSRNTIGGVGPGASNLISGNRWDGVGVHGGSGNLVEGNRIGVDASGTRVLGNNYGIELFSGSVFSTIGGSTAGAGNVISGNQQDGVGIYSDGNRLEGNFIGTDASGTVLLGNQGNGIAIRAFGYGYNNAIGGSQAGAGNTIAYNGQDGVLVDTGIGNAIQENSIFANQSLGIELRNNGNLGQPVPSLTFALSGLGTTVARGTLTAAPDTTFIVELFANPDAGAGQGERFLGNLSVTTDASGQAAFKAILSGINVGAGEFITATATDSAGNTSEFSARLAVTQTPVTTLDAPYNTPQGINDAGQVVGWYGSYPLYHGFLLSGGSYTTLDVPGASATYAQGINDAGQVVGWYTNALGTHGFLLSGGSYTTLDVPGASATYAQGINDAGQVVGWYGSYPLYHGFLLSGGTYTTLDVPGSFATRAMGINDAGRIVGTYYDAESRPTHGFLLYGGTYTTLDVPGAASTYADGINGAGQIVGYTDNMGFLLVGGTYALISVPGAISTGVSGINDAGQIVGSYLGHSGGQGFVATKPSAPGSVAEPVLSGLNPALVNVLLGPSGSPGDASQPGAVVGADPAAPLAGALADSDPLGRYSGGRTRSEAAATPTSLAALRHARDVVFAGLGDPVADGLAGSLLSAGW